MSNGKVHSDGTKGIARWSIYHNYKGASSAVSHADFLGANDPYKSLKTTLKSEINEDA